MNSTKTFVAEAEEAVIATVLQRVLTTSKGCGCLRLQGVPSPFWGPAKQLPEKKLRARLKWNQLGTGANFAEGSGKWGAVAQQGECRPGAEHFVCKGPDGLSSPDGLCYTLSSAKWTR